MESLTDTIVSQLLNSLDPTPVNPSKEESYLAFMVCKNLTDLCETGRAIVNSIESNRKPIDSLPDRSGISLCQQLLKKFYSDDMFIPDDTIGNKPNWSVVASFDRQHTITAFKIYRAIRKNIIGKPEIQKAVADKNKIYFLNNFDQIFSGIPFKEALLKFKNFVASPYTSKDDQDYVWEFFGALVDIFIYEKDNILDLKSM